MSDAADKQSAIAKGFVPQWVEDEYAYDGDNEAASSIVATAPGVAAPPDAAAPPVTAVPL
jgi:hypothetical protein